MIQEIVWSHLDYIALHHHESVARSSSSSSSSVFVLVWIPFWAYPDERFLGRLVQVASGASSGEYSEKKY